MRFVAEFDAVETGLIVNRRAGDDGIERLHEIGLRFLEVGSGGLCRGLFQGGFSGVVEVIVEKAADRIRVFREFGSQCISDVAARKGGGAARLLNPPVRAFAVEEGNKFGFVSLWKIGGLAAGGGEGGCSCRSSWQRVRSGPLQF